MVRKGFVKRTLDNSMQKTKVRALVSLLGFAGTTAQSSAFAVASDTARGSYGSSNVKPFSKIQVLHLDLALYQDGTSVSVDGFIDWFIIKLVGGQSISGFPAVDPPLNAIPYIFRQGRAAIPQLTPNGLPSIYHISGDLKIPPRFQTMAPGDQLLISFIATPAGAGLSYSVNGTISYMFKV